MAKPDTGLGDAFPTIPTPFDGDILQPLRTLIEYRMCVLSGAVREKPLWWEKVHNTHIASRWRAEMREQDSARVDALWGGEERYQYRHPAPREDRDGWGDEDEARYQESLYPVDGRRYGPAKPWPRDAISDAQLDYIFDELRHDAGRVDRAIGIYPASIRGVYESRALVPDELRAALLQGVSVLEDVPEDEKDWHPGSNQQVLDLVHPSLYPLRIGHSLLSTSPPHPITFPEYRERRPDLARCTGDYFVSRRFQWLPTDFLLSPAADTATPLGYINNLHPARHARLYRALPAILARFVPLWERVLSDAATPAPPGPVAVNPLAWYRQRPPPPPGADEATRALWRREALCPFIPEVRPFAPPADADRVTVKLGGRTLQVIVKLASTVLTPDHPKYPGGSWHVEGMANERIVATGLYYYALENLTESRLALRAVVGDARAPVSFAYRQSDAVGYSVAYGLAGDDALSQALGAVRAEAGKCVAFANVYQHRVEPFALADETRAGCRKVLCFFPVDPGTRVLSTSDVLPQQEDWVMEDLERVEGMERLPQELRDITAEYVRVGTISRKEAEEVREKLMEERKAFVVTHNAGVFELPFNMCEH